MRHSLQRLPTTANDFSASSVRRKCERASARLQHWAFPPTTAHDANVTEDNDHVWQTGPEMQILDDERHADGQNVLTSAGANYALHPARENLARPAGEWNTARILVCENQVTQWLNDVEVVTYTLGSSQWTKLVSASKFNAMPDYGRRVAGHIALQDHGDVVSFRNIRVRDLGASSASLRSN